MIFFVYDLMKPCKSYHMPVLMHPQMSSNRHANPLQSSPKSNRSGTSWFCHHPPPPPPPLPPPHPTPPIRVVPAFLSWQASSSSSYLLPTFPLWTPALTDPRDSNDKPLRARRIKRPKYRDDPMSHATRPCTDATVRSDRHNNNKKEDMVILIWEASWKSGPC